MSSIARFMMSLSPTLTINEVITEVIYDQVKKKYYRKKGEQEVRHPEYKFLIMILCDFESTESSVLKWSIES